MKGKELMVRERCQMGPVAQSDGASSHDFATLPLSAKPFSFWIQFFSQIEKKILCFRTFLSRREISRLGGFPEVFCLTLK